MSKKKSKQNKMEKKYQVIGEKIETMKWEHLIELANEHSNTLKTINSKLLNLGALYREQIEKDEKLKNLFNGISNTLNDITRKLLDTMDRHSKVENNKRLFWGGEIDPNDEKAIEYFINLVLIYQAIANDLATFTNTSIIAFTTRLEEVLREEQKEGDNGKPKPTTKQ